MTDQCRRGHPFTPENTLTEPTQRRCRTCRRAAQRAWRARNRDRVNAASRRWRANNAEYHRGWNRAFKRWAS